MKCLFVIFTFLLISSYAICHPMTDPVPDVSYIPGTFAAGDTIAAEFSIGTPENEAGPAYGFHLIHDFSADIEEIDPDSDLTYEFASGWGCENGQCDATIWIDHENQEIHVVISANHLLEDYGAIITIYGIVIDVVPPHNRLAVNREKPNLSEPEVKIYPNPANDYIMISSEDRMIGYIEVSDVFGRQVLSYPVADYLIKIPVLTLAPGIYFIKNPVSDMYRKIQITR